MAKLKQSDLEVYVIFDNAGNIKVTNKSKYNCRIHFRNEVGDKQSLLCNSNSTRNYPTKHKILIFSKGRILSNKITKLPLDDTQFYFENESLHEEFLKLKDEAAEQDFKNFDNDSDEILSNHSTSSTGNISRSWADIADEESKIKIELKIKSDREKLIDLKKKLLDIELEFYNLNIDLKYELTDRKNNNEIN